MIEALLDEVLDASILRDAVNGALAILQRSSDAGKPGEALEAQLAKVQGERERLMTAIESGRTIAGLLEALQALERREVALTSQLSAIASQRPLRRADAGRMRTDLIELS